MNRLIPNKKSKKSGNSSDESVSATIAEANREKEDMKAKYEAKIRTLTDELIGARIVTQAMVLVARNAPDAFFGMITKEANNWSLIELKNIATSIQNELLNQQAQAANGNKKALRPSTAQRLYRYLMDDGKASRRALIQVIGDLHRELVSYETPPDSMPKELSIPNHNYVCEKSVETPAIVEANTEDTEDLLPPLHQDSDDEIYMEENPVADEYNEDPAHDELAVEVAMEDGKDDVDENGENDNGLTMPDSDSDKDYEIFESVRQEE